MLVDSYNKKSSSGGSNLAKIKAMAKFISVLKDNDAQFS